MRCAIAWLVTIASCGVWARGGAVDAETPVALAGFGEIDITPPVGIELGGRGCGSEASVGVLDSLFADVTVLKDVKANRLVMVSLDLVGMPVWWSKQLRSDIAGKLGVPLDHVIVNCSHTHSGPMMYREAMAACGQARPNERQTLLEMARKVTGLCFKTAARLAPVSVYVHQGECDIGIARRGKGAYDMKPCPDGPSDRSVWILRFVSRSGKLRAVLFSYACHPVIVKDSAPRMISADYPGTARQKIRAVLGRSVHTQFLQGPGGNLRPRCLADIEHRVFRKPEPADLDDTGRKLSDAVVAGIARGGRPLSLRIAARMERVDLARGAPPAKSLYEDIARDHSGYLADAARYWLEQLKRGDPAEKVSRWPVGVIRLARDQWIVYLAGEPVVQWATHVRVWFGDTPVAVLGYTQEVFGYLPVDEMLDQDVYEVRSSNYFRVGTCAPFACGLNAAVRRSVLKQIADIESADRQ